MMRLSWFLIFCGCLISCLNEEVELADIDGSYAVPLLDSSLDLIDVSENSEQDVVISEDEEGKLTVSYFGDVISQNVVEIFPPVPYFQDVPLPDTSSMVPLPFENTYVLEKARFFGTRIQIKFHSQFEEDVTVKFTLPEVFKDGQVFSQDYFIPYNGTTPSVFESVFYDMTGWEVITDVNQFNFTYDARLSSGERVTLDYAAMYIEVLNFSYVEGFFGQREFDIEGDVITIGVFNKWLSGGFVFDNPRVRFIVENSFGFPVRSKINELTLTTISGQEFMLEAEGLQDGILFNYPELNEVGVIKDTEFIYTSENSNIGEIFNEKAASVRYDVDAITNSDQDEVVTGFLTDSSFYLVQVALDVPLQLRLNDLKLTDTFDIDLKEFDNFNSLDLKFVSTNAFPFGLDVEAHFIDTISQQTTAVFEPNWLVNSANLLADGSVIPSEEQSTTITIDEGELTEVIKAQKIAIVATFSNSEIAPDQSFWILSEYGLDIKVGAIISNE